MSTLLSAAIIASDEEKNLPACLESLGPLGAEIVVVDGGSRDRTIEIAREAGARVVSRTFTDFADQKQAAVDASTGRWVLSIDADERLGPGLAAEILAAIRGEGGPAGFEIPFEVRFMGRRMRFGGLGSERHLRLFRKDAGGFGGEQLHEGIAVRGRVGRLRARMIHLPYADLDEYLAKMRVYTARAALKRYAAGRRFRAWHHLLPVWEFFKRTVLRLGVLDGTPGIVWAGLSAAHTWIKYLKLRELEAGPEAR